MPRWIDLQCQACGAIEEVSKAQELFDDELTERLPCPQCGSLQRQELPPRVQILVEKKKRPVPTPSLRQKIGAPLPEEVRRVFAKELFDPCSCGEHAPADLYEHDPACHVNAHSFIKPAPSPSETADPAS